MSIASCHRVEHLVRFVAQMGEVAGVVALEHVAERRHLVGLRVGARRREQAGRHARARRLAARPRAARSSRRARPCVGARSAMPITISRSVLWPTSMPAFTDGRREACRDIRESVSSRNGVHGALGRQIIPQQLDLAGQRRRDREAAMADDLGGDALADLALGLGIDRQREVGMGLDVDEARRDGEARGVDGFRRGRVESAGRSRRSGRPLMARSAGTPAPPLPSNRSPPRIRMSCTELLG